MGATEDIIKEKVFQAIQHQLSNIKLKSFKSMYITLSPMKLKLPDIKITNDGFKIKTINKDTGDAIADIPVDIQTTLQFPVVTARFDAPIKVTPKIDLMLGKRK